MIVTGIVGWIDNLMRARRLSRWYCFWRLVVSTLLLVTGLWMVLQFQSGIVPAAMQIKALATAIGFVFVAEGHVAACVSLSHRATRGWGWGPAGMLSIIGLLVGISFLFSGFDLLGFSSRFHSRID